MGPPQSSRRGATFSPLFAALAFVVVAVIVGSALWYGLGAKDNAAGSASTAQSTSRASTSAKENTSSTSTSNSSATFFYLSVGSAVFLNESAMETNMTLAVANNGSDYLRPGAMKNVVPNGTTLVSGTWRASYYDPAGAYICTAPHGMGPIGCGPSLLPAVADGGHIVVTFLITGATVGEPLTLAYSYNGVTESIQLTVT